MTKKMTKREKLILGAMAACMAIVLAVFLGIIPMWGMFLPVITWIAGMIVRDCFMAFREKDGFGGWMYLLLIVFLLATGTAVALFPRILH